MMTLRQVATTIRVEVKVQAEVLGRTRAVRAARATESRVVEAGHGWERGHLTP
jgi:hypothetical protein